MTILTFNELEEYKKSIMSEILLLNESKKFDNDKNIFLSHASLDKNILPKVIAFLEDYDGKVYIDKNDSKLPEITSYKTANILKERIKSLPKFIVCVTSNSLNSKWIPWELGIADGLDKYNNIALLPLDEETTNINWLGTEYLKIYPQIIKDLMLDSYPYRESYMVLDPKTKQKISLSEWITQ